MVWLRPHRYTDGLESAAFNIQWSLWTRPCGPPSAPPTPLPPSSVSFKQVLDLTTATVSIIVTTPDGEQTSIKVWSDAGSLGVTDNVYVEVDTSTPTAAAVSIDSWRLSAKEQVDLLTSFTHLMWEPPGQRERCEGTYTHRIGRRTPTNQPTKLHPISHSRTHRHDHHYHHYDDNGDAVRKTVVANLCLWFLPNATREMKLYWCALLPT